MSDDANKSNRVWIYVLAAVVLTACMAFPCGIGLGWFGKGGTPTPDGKVQVKDGKPGTTWQELQDRLTAKGWATTRGGVGDRMQFSTLGSDGTGADDDFIAREFPTVEEAKAHAARTKDFDQVELFTWDRFTFHGSPGVRARLKQLLP